MRRRYQIAVILPLILLLAGCSPARQAFKRATRDARHHNWDQAVLGYSKAVSLKPDNKKYEFALTRTKFRASQEHFALGRKFVAAGKLDLAIPELQATVLLDPSNQYAANELREATRKYRESLLTAEEKTELERLKEKMQVIGTAPPRLDPASNVPILLKFKDEEVGKIYDILSRVSGINFFYDDKLDLAKETSIDVANVTFEKAMDILMLQNRHFYKVIDENSIIIADDNRQKRQEYQDEVIQTFFLSNADVKEVQTLLRTLLDARKVAQNDQLNAITIRDSPEKIAIARRIIEANDKSKAELVVDVELLQVNRTTLRTLGIDLTQKSVGITFNGPEGGVPLNNLGVLNERGSWFLSPIPGIVINFLKSDSDSKTIAKPQLRVTEGEKANLHIGDRIPIPTTTFNTAATVGTNVVPITSFTYQEVGIIIEIEPRVHHNKEITMILSVEVSDVTGDVQAGSGVSQPIIGSRQINTVIRLKDGETNLLAGLIQERSRTSLSGVPGLSAIPILKRLFGNTEDEVQQTDIVLTLTPHIIRIPDITERDLTALWIGREGNLKLKGSEGSAFGSPFAGPEEEEEIPVDIEAGLPVMPDLDLLDASLLAPALLGEAEVRPLPGEEEPEAPGAGEEPEPSPAVPEEEGPEEGLGPPGEAPPQEETPSPEPPAGEVEAPAEAEPPVPLPPVPVVPIAVSLAPPIVLAQPDSEFNQVIMANVPVEVSRLAFELEWEGASIEYRSISAGNLLAQSGRQPSFQFQRLGEGSLRVETAVASGAGASGTGAVALVRFRAVTPGEVPIRLRNVEAFDSFGQPIPVEAGQGTIRVQ